MERNTNLVLIVDDDPCGAQILKGILDNRDYVFEFAQDGEEALRKAEELDPDVILLDVVMPGMDGFEVCRRLRAGTGVSEAPVLMVTELGDQASRIKGIEAGADDFISKPFVREELMARVRGITRLNRYRLLKAERDRFEWMVENSADGYLVTDGRDVISYANPRARMYLELDDEWAPGGEAFLDLARRRYHPEPAFAWADWLRTVGDSADRKRYLVRPETITANSSWLRCDVRDQVLGGRLRRVIRLSNVTDKVTSMREMRTFHSMLSHKLRTPLYQAQSSLEMLADDDNLLSPEETAELLKMSLDGVNRLGQEILDVLQYLEAPSAHEPGGEFVLSELRVLVHDVARQMHLSPPEVRVADEVASLRTDLSGRIVEWILWELFENSRKFHPEKDPRLEVSLCAKDAGMLLLRVADDGLTLPPEEMVRVFDPYYQCEKRFTGEVSGMGLGLAMVAALCWQVGGSCRMQNREIGPGVVVDILLPRFAG